MNTVLKHIAYSILIILALVGIVEYMAYVVHRENEIAKCIVDMGEQYSVEARINFCTSNIDGHRSMR